MDIQYFLIPMAISLVLMIPVKVAARHFGLYAKQNARTIHHGNIPRIGGVAIFLAFILSSFLFLQENRPFDGIVAGAVVIFLEGLCDDIFDLKPKIKLLFQIAAATLVVFFGRVYLDAIFLPFGGVIHLGFWGYLITYLWIVGITNAVNLLDGLDGLAGGYSSIIFMTIAVLSTMLGQWDVYILCLVLAGSVMGFLYYNFHPASIFMGDCGSQFLGYMIAAISLYGFKRVTFITLLIPVILLFIPIFDTFSAIIRRRLKGESIATPDKMHFHHMLMNNLGLGQTGAVLVIYAVTVLFSLTAFVYVKDQDAGLIMLLVLIIAFDLFIEYTGMISPRYRFLLKLADKIAGRHLKVPADDLLEAEQAQVKAEGLGESTAGPPQPPDKTDRP
jgi:UDP-GlcNAc:undecaprenyl-phosphate GlcNAc-1-phosphate transferase